MRLVPPDEGSDVEDAGAWTTSPGDPEHRSGPVHPGPAGPTDEQALAAYELHAVRSYSARQIGAELGVSHTTARRWVARGRELHAAGESMGKACRREERQDADTWYRLRLVEIAQDVTARILDCAEGHRLALAILDRLAPLHGTDAPRRLARVRRGGAGEVAPDVVVPADLFESLAGIPRDEIDAALDELPAGRG